MLRAELDIPGMSIKIQDDCVDDLGAEPGQGFLRGWGGKCTRNCDPVRALMLISMLACYLTCHLRYALAEPRDKARQSTDKAPRTCDNVVTAVTRSAAQRRPGHRLLGSSGPSRIFRPATGNAHRGLGEEPDVPGGTALALGTRPQYSIQLQGARYTATGCAIFFQEGWQWLKTHRRLG